MTQTWFWKDDLHLARRVYYGKIIRGQPTFIALDYLPDFVAAIGGRGQEIERDPARLYQEGRLSRAAFVVYQHLLDHPAQPTRELRRGLGGSAGDRSPATDHALLELQRRFLICKVDLTGRERGTYSYVWDLAEHFLPDEFAEAQGTSADAARDRIRRRLAEFGIRTNPASEEKLFWWRG